MNIQRHELKPSNLPKAAVHSLAERLALNIGYHVGDELNHTIEKLKGSIKYCDDFEVFEKEYEHNESILIDEDGSFEIILPLSTSVYRDRFTIAHELGHYVLHYWYAKSKGEIEDNRKYYATRFGSNRIEWEANWFAAAFLMPAAIYTEHYNSLGDLPSSDKHTLLASIFKVSTKASANRASTLGLE